MNVLIVAHFMWCRGNYGRDTDLPRETLVMWRRRYWHALTLYQPQMVNSRWVRYGVDSGGDCGVNLANGGVGVPAGGVVLSGGRYLRTKSGANHPSVANLRLIYDDQFIFL